MRQPSAIAESLTWWRHRLTRASRSDPIPNEPRAGFYQCRLVKNGPLVPVRIWLHQEIGDDGELLDEPRLRCEVNGQEREPDDAWSYCANMPIAEARFRYMTATKEWAEAHAPNEPAAKPREPILPLYSPIIRF